MFLALLSPYNIAVRSHIFELALLKRNAWTICL